MMTRIVVVFQHFEPQQLKREKSFVRRSMPVALRMVHAQHTVRGGHAIVTHERQHSRRLHAQQTVHGDAAKSAASIGKQVFADVDKLSTSNRNVCDSNSSRVTGLTETV